MCNKLMNDNKIYKNIIKFSLYSKIYKNLILLFVFAVFSARHGSAQLCASLLHCKAGPNANTNEGDASSVGDYNIAICRFKLNYWQFMNAIPRCIACILTRRHIKKRWKTAWFYFDIFLINFDIQFELVKRKKKSFCNCLRGLRLRMEFSHEYADRHVPGGCPTYP